MHALVIGINKYKAQVDLRGAVADADAVQDYLLHELNVPASQIINLRDSAATRKAILEAWLSMRNDATIKEGDPVLIYYAGHGASAEAPPDWKDKAGGDSAKVQLLVPHDYDGEKVHPIADRTIGYMLDELARVKGDNIVRMLMDILRFFMLFILILVYEHRRSYSTDVMPHLAPVSRTNMILRSLFEVWRLTKRNILYLRTSMKTFGMPKEKQTTVPLL